jgi:hypothetical protein
MRRGKWTGKKKISRKIMKGLKTKREIRGRCWNSI